MADDLDPIRRASLLQQANAELSRALSIGWSDLLDGGFMYLIIILLSILWFFIGIVSFLFWWTKDQDFTSNLIPFALMVGIMGPLAFYVGFMIHGNDGRVLIKSKK